MNQLAIALKAYQEKQRKGNKMQPEEDVNVLDVTDGMLSDSQVAEPELEEYFDTKKKGAPGSGGWGHGGRPGKVGGSSPGSGLGRIGVKPGSTLSERQAASKKFRGDRQGSKPKTKKPATIAKPAKEFKDYTNDRDSIANHYNAKKQCLVQPVECAALLDYVEIGFESINDSLRSRDRVSPNVRAIDSWLDEAPRIPADMKVYRQIDPSVVAALSAGDTFQDKGFVSTTISTSSADRIREGDDVIGGAARIEIRVPKGAKGAFISDIAADIGSGDEEELLLPRGSNFKIIQAKGNELIAELIM